MKTRYLVVLSLFCSFSAFSATSLAEKRDSVEELMKLSKHAPMLNFEAYQRELNYEEMGLSIDERAENEVNLVAEKIKAQVADAYSLALSELGDSEAARKQVEAAIETDLTSAHQDYQFELKKLAFETLSVVHSGGAISEVTSMPNIQKNITKQVKERNNFLNLGSLTKRLEKKSLFENDGSKYDNKSDLLKTLVADKGSDPDIYGPSSTVNTTVELSSATKISLQVKMEFLGASLEAGPTIAFKREIATSGTIQSEGLQPALSKTGEFDFYKRDSKSNIIRVNGKAQRKNIIFYCNSQMNFQTEYTGGGGFSYMGIGADVSVSTTFKHSVRLNSRKVKLPDIIGNKTTNVKVISDLCHKDFVATKINNKLTVFDSLDLMMRNVASGLIFSHSKTTCSKNADCNSWFNKQASIKKYNNVARCVQHKEEKYQFCQIRGSENQKCPVYSRGELVSSGVNEYQCDWHLKCVTVEPASYVLGFEWTPAIGKCRKK